MALSQAEAIERVADLLRDEGYQAKVRDDGTIASAAGGLKITLVVDGRALQLYCGVNLDLGTEARLEILNAFNQQYRWIKAFRDDENDLVAVSDHLFDVESDDAPEVLKRIIGLFEGSLSLIRELLKELQVANAEPSASESSD